MSLRATGGVGYPVERYAVEGGRLVLWFSAADYEGLRRAVGALGDRWPAVQLLQVVPSPTPEGPAVTVLIDRRRLTERQLEVLETAYRMGYFERSRKGQRHRGGRRTRHRALDAFRAPLGGAGQATDRRP